MFLILQWQRCHIAMWIIDVRTKRESAEAAWDVYLSPVFLKACNYKSRATRRDPLPQMDIHAHKRTTRAIVSLEETPVPPSLSPPPAAPLAHPLHIIFKH